MGAVICFSISRLAKDKNRLPEPGKTYTLKYRLIVFNGKFSAEKAERLLAVFASASKPLLNSDSSC